jgi:hypothetical protein
MTNRQSPSAIDRSPIAPHPKGRAWNAVERWLKETGRFLPDREKCGRLRGGNLPGGGHGRREREQADDRGCPDGC